MDSKIFGLLNQDVLILKINYAFNYYFIKKITFFINIFINDNYFTDIISNKFFKNNLKIFYIKNFPEAEA
jgi:hypothetical protein